MKNSLNSLEHLLERHFGFSDEPRRLSGGLSHEVFSLNREKIIVKIYSKEISTKRLDEEAYALELVAKSSMINTPKLIRSNSGELRVPYNQTLLSCFKKIEGERKYLLTECPKLEEIYDIGKYLGKLHSELASSLAHTEGDRSSQILELSKGLFGVDSREVQQILKNLSQANAPYFITHGDFQQSNLLYLGNQISGVIDFEYSTFDFRVNDLAGCLSNLLSAAEERHSLDLIVKKFIDGYQESFGQKILPVELDSLPDLLRLIWRVNLYWVETKLKENRSKEITALLELYCKQTIRWLNNCT